MDTSTPPLPIIDGAQMWTLTVLVGTWASTPPWHRSIALAGVGVDPHHHTERAVQTQRMSALDTALGHRHSLDSLSASAAASLPSLTAGDDLATYSPLL